MKHRRTYQTRLVRSSALLCAGALICSISLLKAADSDVEQRLRVLAEQNEKLQKRLADQDTLIRSLNDKVTALQEKAGTEAPAANSSAASLLGGAASKVNISGQLAVGYFKTGAKGQFPNGEFRVDEARVFLDAKAWDDIYGFIELNMFTRESGDENVHVGEAYIDWERVLKWRGLDSLVNFRVGRLYIPFGEEYQVRYAVDDPLITHSIMDLWGIDEGIEMYGSQGKFQYACAVQNGGHSGLRDFTSDKSLAARISYDATKWLHLSVSVMRTGDLSSKNDQLSEMWFGNAFFRSIGTGTRFSADLVEGDVQFLFPWGHVKLAGGAVHYDDNSAADFARDLFYYSAEGVYRFTKQFYGATRFSHVLADGGGYPIVGLGNWGDHFYGRFTDNLWRWSAGVGYTPSPNVVLKVEYALERGDTNSGEHRQHEDFFGAQAALKF